MRQKISKKNKNKTKKNHNKYEYYDNSNRRFKYSKLNKTKNKKNTAKCYLCCKKYNNSLFLCDSFLINITTTKTTKRRPI